MKTRVKYNLIIILPPSYLNTMNFTFKYMTIVPKLRTINRLVFKNHAIIASKRMTNGYFPSIISKPFSLLTITICCNIVVTALSEMNKSPNHLSTTVFYCCHSTDMNRLFSELS